MPKTANRMFLASGLLDGWYWFDNALQKTLRAQGFPDFNNSQSAMLFHISEGVTRPIEIARKMRLSRQAIRHIANQLIEAGILVSLDDPDDGRSKVLKYTPKAKNLRLAAQNVLLSMEETLAGRLGREEFNELRRLLDRDWGEARTAPQIATRNGKAASVRKAAPKLLRKKSA
jgi:DNA-binding MarR family transcriptional regulator